MNLSFKLNKLLHNKITNQVIEACGGLENLKYVNIAKNNLNITLHHKKLFKEEVLRHTRPFQIKMLENVITIDYGLNSYPMAMLINAQLVKF